MAAMSRLGAMQPMGKGTLHDISCQFAIRRSAGRFAGRFCLCANEPDNRISPARIRDCDALELEWSNASDSRHNALQ
ncbi:hypothetical protein TH25_12065 [Thalassospira profundimaris]|uniref:Uncharacterized protein n=1 Tax=Thalassospira profundimaris TaxID=502049 RepID=A0A367X9Q7_9PROT|nr:hypothetical protein TH25_12065 [Thalassospira profundimaris]